MLSPSEEREGEAPAEPKRALARRPPEAAIDRSTAFRLYSKEKQCKLDVERTLLGTEYRPEAVTPELSR